MEWRAGVADPRRLPVAASTALAAGSDSPALRELAAISESEARQSSRSTIDDLVTRACGELGYRSLITDQASRVVAPTREDAVAFAYDMSKRMLTGEFQPPVGLFKAAQNVEAVLTRFQWLDDDFPPAVTGFVEGWQASGPESDAAIIATAQRLVREVEFEPGK